MYLTQELLDTYAGGQLEVQNRNEGYLYRGEICDVVVAGSGLDESIKVSLNWMAKADGYPPLPTGWTNSDTRDYVASLLIYVPSDIGDGRIALSSHITGEMVVIYPPDGSKLDPAVVNGLDLSAITSS